nr:hypothetical protein [Dechloromonas sp.]
MLDLEHLFGSQPAPATVSENPEREATARHSRHNGNTPNSYQVCLPNPLQHKALSTIDTGDTADTVHLQGGEDEQENRAPGGGAAVDDFALHPAAVILALAYCRKVKAANDERVAALLHLQTMPPGQQVQHWHSVCIDAGLKPWEELLIPAPSSGLDCTMCKHLTTRQFSSSGVRRNFWWACGLGYLILETGRGTERIWIAPPECNSFERWRPGDGNTGVVVTSGAQSGMAGG